MSSYFITFFVINSFLMKQHSVWLYPDSDQHKAALRLLAVSRLINQAVGDALSGLFLVEAILKHMRWSIHKWNELYQDLPSRQLKVSLSLDIFVKVI